VLEVTDAYGSTGRLTGMVTPQAYRFGILLDTWDGDRPSKGQDKQEKKK